MDSLRLRSQLRQILLLALAAPSPLACGTTTASPQGPSTSSDAGMDASEPTFDPDGGIAADAVAPDDASAVSDAANDVADGGDASGPCAVIDPGYPGGAVCKPMIVSCNPAPADPIDCSMVCNGVTDAGCYAADGGGQIYCYYGCGGRRPDGFDMRSRDALASVGGFFANLAALEAASVDAFEILAAELIAHGAPAALVGEAARAADDEVRHSKIIGALARRYGYQPASRPTERRPIRDLEEIATENAREGCVRETFGALVAMYQAERASDPVIRRAMKRIAEDETRHASLAWEVASWAASKLDAEARARVESAMQGAFEELANEATLEPARELRAVAGMPSAAQTTRMVAAFHALEAFPEGASSPAE